MERLDGIILDIATELNAVVLRTKNEIMTLFPSMLSYDILTGHKYYISHDLDPPWDCSGILFSEPTNAAFHIGDYNKIGDFFDEYTGQSKATFISGCGLDYETYEEHYEEWMEDQYRNAHYTVLLETDREILMALAREVFGVDNHDVDDMHVLIDDLIAEIDEFEDRSIIHAEELRMKISKMDLPFVYKLGEKHAKAQLHKEKEEKERREKEIEMERAAFMKFWSILEKKYKLAYQKPFPKRIEMHEFKSFEQFLDNNNVLQQEKALIGKYAPISFSNAASSKLSSE